MTSLSKNARLNGVIIDHYRDLTVEAVCKKQPQQVIDSLKGRWKRMENCNRFWTTETYEASRVKLLLQTFLCRDKFCLNCKRVKRMVMEKRFMPYMEQYKERLYHMTLTVPACTAENLKPTIKHMATCFKTLVNYLYGSKKLNGLDFTQYGFEGCIRTLEITYKGDNYRPHYHVATVFTDLANVDKKRISNKFSMSGNLLFSEFEAIIQRVWWLLINRQRLTRENIYAETAEDDRYSCTVEKFRPEDYLQLLGYMTKIRSEDNEYMEYENFKTLFHALDRVRQVQGYGVFYNVKAAEDSPEFSADEYHDIAAYIAPNEQPSEPDSEPLSRLLKDNSYTILRGKRTPRQDIIKQ
jgi:hypothetical protein